MMPSMNRVLNAIERILPATILVAATLFSLAAAQPGSAPLAEPAFDELLTQFLGLDAGFEALDPDLLEAEIAAGLPDSGSVFAPTGALDPFTKAVMVVETLEGRLERSRYQATLRLVNVEYEGVAQPAQYVLVTAERYNIGPVVHAALVEELGADVVAPLEEFGVGPNTSWRFVMQPLQGHAAMLVAASRLELDADEAAAAPCLYGPCLALGWDGGPPAWDAVETAPLDELALVFDLETADFQLLDPEVMMAIVVAAAGFDPYVWEVGGPEREIAHAFVDLNLGQGATISSVLVQRELLDDSLAAIWHMAIDVGSPEARSVYRAFECRRGEEAFAPAGSFCP